MLAKRSRNVSSIDLLLQSEKMNSSNRNAWEGLRTIFDLVFNSFET
jgi:hypothetical protein